MNNWISRFKVKKKIFLLFEREETMSPRIEMWVFSDWNSKRRPNNNKRRSSWWSWYRSTRTELTSCTKLNSVISLVSNDALTKNYKTKWTVTKSASCVWERRRKRWTSTMKEKPVDEEKLSNRVDDNHAGHNLTRRHPASS